MSAAATTRELEADLAILDRFDTIRDTVGHDYGGGQRYAELVRRRRELIRLGGREYPELRDFTAAELDAALRRIADPRIRRIEREDYRRSTKGTRRTREAWDRLVRLVDRIAEGA